MNLSNFLTEAEIKRQFKEVARFKAGELSYIIKMGRYNIEIELEDGNKETIEAVSPDLAISILTSRKRNLPEREEDDSVGYLRRKVRKSFNDLYDKSYKLITPEEAEAYNTGNALQKAQQIMIDYFNKYNTQYIIVHPYKDNSSKRTRLYELMLKKIGYNKIYNEDKVILFSKDKKLIKSAEKPVNKTYKWENPPQLIKNIRFILSNI